ncbi:MAG: ABC transporter permease, partial [Clostridia bacterium]|nr:ABC transporter permease [Clostridia bacterium]
IVADRETGVNKDFASSPINRSLLIGSYFLFNLIVTILICFMFLLVCFIYLGCMGEFCITFVDFLSMFGILIFSSIVSVLLTIFVCSFVSRDATMASITTIFSTAIGFLIGAYMPMAMLPEFARNFCVFVPGTFACSLLRYSFMSTPLAQLSSYVTELMGGSELIKELSLSFGYNVEFFGISLEPWAQAVGQVIFIVILLVANVLAGKNLVKIVGGMGKKLKPKKK